VLSVTGKVQPLSFSKPPLTTASAQLGIGVAVGVAVGVGVCVGLAVAVGVGVTVGGAGGFITRGRYRK
jgi:hypothetical protein